MVLQVVLLIFMGIQGSDDRKKNTLNCILYVIGSQVKNTRASQTRGSLNRMKIYMILVIVRSANRIL